MQPHEHVVNFKKKVPMKKYAKHLFSNDYDLYALNQPHLKQRHSTLETFYRVRQLTNQDNHILKVLSQFKKGDTRHSVRDQKIRNKLLSQFKLSLDLDPSQSLTVDPGDRVIYDWQDVGEVKKPSSL